MKQCYGCFNQIDDNCNVCPYCGYIQNSPVPNNFCLTPGTLLSGRYIIGKSICSDRRSITYSSWDNYSESRVTIKEYFPSKHVTRDSQTLNIEPLNVESQAEFEKGFHLFVDEAKSLFNVSNGIKLLDCIAENNTAYMIMEHPEEQAFETPAATETKTLKSSSLSSAITKLNQIPLFIKILVPALLIFAIVLIIVLSINGKDKNQETEISETSETTTLVTETTVESSSVPVIDAEIMNFGDHSFVAFTGPASWEEAEEYCESLGGHLAVINSVLENNAIWEYAKAFNYDYTYIGLSDSETEGTWKWVTGDALNYTNWGEGKPDTNTQTANYAAFDIEAKDGTWNDYPYMSGNEDITTGFICEWDYRLESATATESAAETSAETTSITSETTTEPAPDMSITEEQAELAFTNYMVDEIFPNFFEKYDYEYLRIYRFGSSDGYSVFSWEHKNDRVVEYYISLSTGEASTVEYTPSYSEVLSEGHFDFNAWDYLYDPPFYDDSEQIKLEQYLYMNIDLASEYFSDYLIYGKRNSYGFNSEYVDFWTFDAFLLEPYDYVARITLRDSGTSDFSIYGIYPGMSCDEAIERLLYEGAYYFYCRDDHYISFQLDDGYWLAIDYDESETITYVALAESPDWFHMWDEY